MACRRMARPPFLASVTNFSTKGRNSLAFGSVVAICSCLSAPRTCWQTSPAVLGGAIELAMNLAVTHGALSYSFLNFILRDMAGGPLRRMRVGPHGLSNDPRSAWRARRYSPAASPALPCRGAAPSRQHFLDLVQRLAAEVRSSEHLCFGLLHEIADIDDIVVLQAIGRADRQFEFVDLLEEVRVEARSVTVSCAPSLHGSSKLTNSLSWSCRIRAA